MAASERLGAALRAAVVRLTAAGIEAPRVDAEWLVADVLDTSRPALALRLDEPLPPELARRLEAMVAQRAARIPLQRIVGAVHFRGLALRITPDVLVPRPETELLVELALDDLPVLGRRLRAVDLGTGSGCIACALAAERPDLDVLAVDRVEAAARVARANARALGLAGRVRVVVGDVHEALRAGGADLLVANPPYLPSALIERLAPEVRDHEPRAALDGGADGLDVVRRIVAAAPQVLRPGGALWLEILGHEQSVVVQELLARDPGFDGTPVVREDLAGFTRFVAAWRPGRARRGPASARLVVTGRG